MSWWLFSHLKTLRLQKTKIECESFSSYITEKSRNEESVSYDGVWKMNSVSEARNCSVIWWYGSRYRIAILNRQWRVSPLSVINYPNNYCAITCVMYTCTVLKQPHLGLIDESIAVTSHCCLSDCSCFHQPSEKQTCRYAIAIFRPFWESLAMDILSLLGTTMCCGCMFGIKLQLHNSMEWKRKNNINKTNKKNRACVKLY